MTCICLTRNFLSDMISVFPLLPRFLFGQIMIVLEGTAQFCFSFVHSTDGHLLFDTFCKIG